MSWGTPEFSGEASFDSTFSAPGVVFVASSGDSGASIYPSASPNVLSVGGTVLSTDQYGEYLGEMAWPLQGAGPSAYEPGRSTPDVGFNAGYPVMVFDENFQIGESLTGWIPVEGTSAGAPPWAGIVALADEGRALAGEAPLAGPSAIRALSEGRFHPVAGVGLGSPQAELVVAGLTGPAEPVVLAVRGYGVQRYEDSTGWVTLTPSNATLTATDARGDVAAEFPGYGLWLYRDGDGWVRLTPADQANALGVDDGIVAASFTGYGVWRWEGSWTQLDAVDATAVAVDARGDVAASFAGYGVQEYSGATWTPLTPSEAALLQFAAGGELTGEFAGYGAWEWDGTVWSPT